MRESLLMPAAERHAQVMTLLRAGPATVRQIADGIGLSFSRADDVVFDMLQAGMIRKAGLKYGVGRPAVLYEAV